MLPHQSSNRVTFCLSPRLSRSCQQRHPESSFACFSSRSQILIFWHQHRSDDHGAEISHIFRLLLRECAEFGSINSFDAIHSFIVDFWLNCFNSVRLCVGWNGLPPSSWQMQFWYLAWYFRGGQELVGLLRMLPLPPSSMPLARDGHQHGADMTKNQNVVCQGHGLSTRTEIFSMTRVQEARFSHL